MLLRTQGVIGKRIFDEGPFRQLVLSKLQPVQAVFVSLQNNFVDELAAYANRNLEIIRAWNSEIYSVKEIPKQHKMTFQMSVMFQFVIIIFIIIVDAPKLPEEARHEKNLSHDFKT